MADLEDSVEGNDSLDVIRDGYHMLVTTKSCLGMPLIHWSAAKLLLLRLNLLQAGEMGLAPKHEEWLRTCNY